MPRHDQAANPSSILKIRPSNPVITLTELTGVAQSLITTCRLHDINPYDYLVDVLQRVGQHPARDIGQLTPRCWKAHFADNPLRSDLYRFTQHSHS